MNSVGQTFKLAYLGMGIMGAAMASHLVGAGYAVNIWNRTKGKAESIAVVKQGAFGADTLQAAVEDADIVFSCLGDEKDVASVLTGAAGVSSWVKKGTIIVDFSTIGPATAQQIALAFSKIGCHFLDAPVTGGDIGAKNGTLTIMVGGDAQAFADVRPYLMHMGKTLVHCGPSGSGQALKLANQVLCAVNLVAVVEALELARSLGLDPALVVDSLGNGAGGSWSLNNLGPRILQNDFAPGFSIRHMLKDLRLVDESLPGRHLLKELAGTNLAVDLFNKVVAAHPEDGLEMGTQAMHLAYGGDSA